MDKIIIKGLRVFAYHGVNPEEKVDGQNFVVDIIAYRPLLKAGKTDDINDTVSYAQMRKTVSRVLVEDKYNLLEKVAHRVAEQILLEYESIERVDVHIEKPEAPINAVFDYVGVEIARTREDLK